MIYLENIGKNGNRQSGTPTKAMMVQIIFKRKYKIIEKNPE